MKIVCSSCGAKYSIADEKVEGKVFKIRCKKCSNVIMVKGTEGEDVVSDAGSDAGAAEWYVVIDGDQVGPITSVEIDSYFMSGRIDRETYVWRDGLSDWQPMYEVSAFGHLTQDTAGPEEKTQISEGFGGDDYGDGMNAGGADAGGFGDMDSEPGDSDATVSMSANDAGFDENNDFGGGFSDFGGGDDAPQDDLAYAAADEGGAAAGGGGFGGGFESFDSGGGGGGLETSGGGGGGGADHGGMFASFDAPESSGSSGGGDDDFLGFSSGGSDAAPEPASNGSNGVNGGGAAANNMIGQRNENSVLFSLSSLDQVQAVSPEPTALGGGGPSPAAGGGGDAGVTEGSGLIDIRSLASAHQSMKGQGNQDDSVDPFAGGTMAMPALMPMGSHRSNKGLIIAGVVGLVLFLGVAVAAIVVVLNSSGKEPQTKIVEKIIVQKESGDDGEKDSAKEAEEAKAAEAKALAAAEEKDDGEKAEEEEKDEKSSKGSSSRSSRKSASKTEKKDDPAPAPSRSSDDGKDDIDKLLGSIDKKKDEDKPKPKPEPRESSTKSKLSKSDVSGTIRRYSGRIATCKRSQNSNNLDGTMWVKFAIKPNGRTSNVSVATGKFNGTDVGNCVKKAVQGMRFPATSASKNVDIKYPFKL